MRQERESRNVCFTEQIFCIIENSEIIFSQCPLFGCFPNFATLSDFHEVVF